MIKKNCLIDMFNLKSVFNLCKKKKVFTFIVLLCKQLCSEKCLLVE